MKVLRRGPEQSFTNHMLSELEHYGGLLDHRRSEIYFFAEVLPRCCRISLSQALGFMP
jgi:hypothetical protein